MQMRDFRLDEHVAIVTGAGRGIGAGIAMAYAQAGAGVVLVARTRQQLDAVAARIRARGEEAYLHAAAHNTNAIRLYESLGFATRTTCDYAVITPATAGARPAGDPPAPHAR